MCILLTSPPRAKLGARLILPVSVPTLSKPGLLVMDVDSTLIDEEVIDELGVVAGCGEEIAGVTARAMRGELEFCDALRARVALLEGPADLRVRHGA